jgi:hypothetical protein
MLNLKNNAVGDEGAEALADAFRENKVSKMFVCVPFVDIFAFLSKVLTTLNLADNEIGWKGKRRVLETLDKNTTLKVSLC